MYKMFKTKKKKNDTQLQTAQLSAGQQIENRIDKNMAGLDAKVRSIKKETVKSQFIKKEAISYDESLFEDEFTYDEEQSQSVPSFKPSSHGSTKRSRQPETVDLRSPPI